MRKCARIFVLGHNLFLKAVVARYRASSKVIEEKTTVSSSLSLSFYLVMQATKMAANEAGVDLQYTNKM